MGKAKSAAVEPTVPAADDDALLALLAAGLRLQSNDALFKVSGNTLAHRTLLREALSEVSRLGNQKSFHAMTEGDVSALLRLKQSME